MPRRTIKSPSTIRPTPGEWVGTTPAAGHGCYVRTDLVGGFNVAWLGTNSAYRANESHHISTQEALANATLMAASKDLLAALQNALPLLDPNSAEAAQAQLAINKATLNAKGLPEKTC